jgi:hypothetical protein
MTNGVFIDRSFKHVPTWAVVWNGALLPVRFGIEDEAWSHLNGLVHGTDPMVPRRAREPEAIAVAA